MGGCVSKKRCEIARIIYFDGEAPKILPVYVHCLRLWCEIVEKAGYQIEGVEYVG